MKTRGLMVAILIFFILAGTLYWSNHHKPAEDAAKASGDTPPAILKLDASAIRRLDLEKKDGKPIVLTKADSGEWKITKPQPYGADQTVVSGVLSSLSSLNSERMVEDQATDLKQYGLDQAALQLDITEKDNKTQKLLIGDDTPTGGATYAMLAGDPRVFTMASYAKNTVDKNLNDLRDKRLLTVNADKISRIELVRKNQDIEFGRNKDDWQILKPKPLRADRVQVGELITKLTDARMDLSRSDKELTESAPAFVRATPVATAKVTDQSGTQELQVRKNKDTYYAKSSVVEGTYKVDSTLGQALDKGLDDFRNKKLFDFGFNEPTKIEMHHGAKSYFLSKTGPDWWSNGKKTEVGSARDFISKLRDLTADRFVESGVANPAMDITVTSDDGKRVEKVFIAKSGNSYLARRENEPTLYQFDSSSIDALEKSADEIKPGAAPGK